MRLGGVSEMSIPRYRGHRDTAGTYRFINGSLTNSFWTHAASGSPILGTEIRGGSFVLRQAAYTYSKISLLFIVAWRVSGGARFGLLCRAFKKSPS